MELGEEQCKANLFHKGFATHFLIMYIKSVPLSK